MVRASTQQAVDRIVGTAVIIGLSVVFVRWLSHPPLASMLEEKNTQSSRNKRYSWMPWWWPVIALQRWSDKSRKDKECKEDNKDQVGNIEKNDGDYEHQGSCHCSSITFVLRGPQRLQAVDSPGKIRYPHIPTSANRFQLIRGETDMRFYYEEDKDDSSSITFDHAVEERNDANNQASGAHVFCGNCGVHVFHADRSSGELEVNANCLDGGETTLVFREQPSQQGKKWTPLSRSQSSLSSTMEVDNDVEKLAKNSTIETVSETEPFLGSASFLESSEDRKSSMHRKESISSDPTQSESYSTTMMAESDDLSMASSSITGASMSMYHSSLSVASGAAPTHDRADRAGLPPLPPSRISSSHHRLVPPSRLSSSDRSVKTLPPRFGERPGYASGGVGGGVGSSWSVASMESNDLDGGDVGKTTISPRVRDQMKKYMQKYT